MVPPLQELPVAQHKNHICILHRRQTMRHHDHGAAASRALKRRLDEALALRVERAGRLVEEQDAGLANQRARNGDALLLAARQRDAARANVGVVALGQGDDEVVHLGLAADAVEVLVGDGGFVDAEKNIFANGSWITWGAK
ncbi:hypothetical protein BBAD15_g9081 [Beauveria bassiana D1-5]|uniref:Uncharacterized protein n=1 Tax=Beauveria bassiana D1-5 TaxID=1245745 RepID=A0A0A2VCN9_BEABA|nr:hypothetical protein BBAD15_g9081 [Beauveria bassiana D1-5]